MWFSLSAPNSGDGFEFGEPYIFFFDRDLKTSPILVSITTSGLNPYTRSFEPGNDLAFILALPTYTAIAWFHKKLPSDLQGRNLRDVLDEAEQFALEDYNLALMKGNKLPADKKSEIINKLARYTGLSPKYIEQTNMRIRNGRFEKELLRDEHQIVGSIDARFKGKDSDSAGERFESDPAHSAISGAFAAMINHYFRTELKYENDMNYELRGKVRPWDRPRDLTLIAKRREECSAGVLTKEPLGLCLEH